MQIQFSSEAAADLAWAWLSQQSMPQTTGLFKKPLGAPLSLASLAKKIVDNPSALLFRDIDPLEHGASTLACWLAHHAPEEALSGGMREILLEGEDQVLVLGRPEPHGTLLASTPPWIRVVCSLDEHGFRPNLPLEELSWTQKMVYNAKRRRQIPLELLLEEKAQEFREHMKCEPLSGQSLMQAYQQKLEIYMAVYSQVRISTPAKKA